MRLTLLQFQAAAQVLSLTKELGIYIHIPFCVTKCTYCNFYSAAFDEATKDKYCEKLITDLKKWGAEISRPISSVYIGGGTPTALGGERLFAVLNTVNKSFIVLPGAEITVEGNPADDYTSIAPLLQKGGCNRFSLGVQSANESELKTLGRRHTNSDVIKAVKTLRENGIENISVDLMLGLPSSDLNSLEKSIDFALKVSPQHISAYILKLENGTPLKLKAQGYKFPNDDEICEQYLFLCEKLRKNGYKHYEISNFSLENYESQHNNSYWECKEYLGFGPSAHSFYNGKRFYFENDLQKYLQNSQPIPDGVGGTPQEFIMLSLRLKKGLSAKQYEERFGKALPENFSPKAQKLQEAGLCDIIEDRISLTDNGMLVSNQIINYFLEEL